MVTTAAVGTAVAEPGTQAESLTREWYHLARILRTPRENARRMVAGVVRIQQGVVPDEELLVSNRSPAVHLPILLSCGQHKQFNFPGIQLRQEIW